MSTIPPSDLPPDGQPSQPHPVATPVAPQVVVQQQATAFGRYGKFLLVLLGLAVMAIFGMMSSYESYFSPPDKPQEKFHSLNAEADEKIAVVRVAGTIIEGDDFVKQQLDRVREDDNVVAVVLRIDSPGGTVTQSDYLYHHTRKLCEERELPLVVSMGSMCASGGYYLAMAVGDEKDVIFAEPTTWTGSIGVVIPRYNLSGFLTSHDIEDDSIASHPYKLMGSPTRQLSEEEQAKEKKLFEELIAISFDRFKDIVRSGRPKFQNNAAAIDTVTTGQIFTASQALELGLVDKIGFIEAAIKRAAELANRDPENLRCIKYEKPPTTLTTLLSAQASQTELLGADLRSFLDLTAPRAYYLCTWLPSILTNSRP